MSSVGLGDPGCAVAGRKLASGWLYSVSAYQMGRPARRPDEKRTDLFK